jgi:hypothetical protein
MHRHLPSSVILAALVGLSVCGCATESSAPGPATTSSAGAATRADAAYNDNALFLAGLPVASSSPYYALERTDAWKSYASVFEENWSHVDRDQLKPIETFAQTRIAPLHSRVDFVFYPFAGPDVLYAMKFFPKAPAFVLCGLEPVGDIQTADQLNQNLDRNLKRWLWALFSIFNRSFFVTTEMNRNFNGQVSSGVLPVIDLLLARTGSTLEAVQFGTIDESGRFVAESHTPGTAPESVEITFRANAEAVPRKLYYVDSDLGAPFSTHPGLSRFLESLGTPATLIKSGSFLLQGDKFAALRDQILATSGLILEDDSGIPYRYFSDPRWRVQLYGAYSKPGWPFQDDYQKDLATDASNPGKTKPLGFSFGYGAYHRPSVLILAQRIRD